MIPFHDLVLIQGDAVLDEDTGDMVVGAPITSRAKISFETEEVTDRNGQKTVSMIKIYLPKETQIDSDSKLVIGEKTYCIKQIAPKRFLNGKLAYTLVWC